MRAIITIVKTYIISSLQTKSDRIRREIRDQNYTNDHGISKDHWVPGYWCATVYTEWCHWQRVSLERLQYLVAHKVLGSCDRATGLHSRLRPGVAQCRLASLTTSRNRLGAGAGTLSSRTPARTHCAGRTAYVIALASRPPSRGCNESD